MYPFLTFMLLLCMYVRINPKWNLYIFEVLFSFRQQFNNQPLWNKHVHTPLSFNFIKSTVIFNISVKLLSSN